jgi:hypothetical protein
MLKMEAVCFSETLVSPTSSHGVTTQNNIVIITAIVSLGGLVVSVLATGPKVRGFKPGRGRWILRVIKSIARLPSDGK